MYSYFHNFSHSYFFLFKSSYFLFIFILPFVHVSFSLTFPTPFTRSFVFPTALGEKTSSVISGQTPTLGTCATPPWSPTPLKRCSCCCVVQFCVAAILCVGARWPCGGPDGRTDVCAFSLLFIFYSLMQNLQLC